MRASSRPFAFSASLSVAVSAALLAPVVIVTGYMALQDFGEWNYQGYVLGRAFNGETLGVATLKDYPVPYSLGNLVLGGLGAVIPHCSPGSRRSPSRSCSAPWRWRRTYAAAASTGVSRLRCWRPSSSSGRGSGTATPPIRFGLAVLTAWLAVPRERRSSAAIVLVFSLLTFFSHALIFSRSQ